MLTEQPSPTSRKTLLYSGRHLRKTKLCVFFQQGACHRQSTCQFAHGESELQEAPVLYKTRICPELDRCFNKNCTYAHNQEELHVSDVSFKTAMCRWHLKGMCSSGETCRFAHDMKELRGIPGEQQGRASKVAPMAGKAKNKVNVCFAAANGMVQAREVEEENLAPGAEAINISLNQSTFIQLGANKDDTSDWDLPVKVYSKLSTEVGFLDSLRLPRGLHLSNDFMDFPIIPETPSWVNESPKEEPTGWVTDPDILRLPSLRPDQADQGISSLVTQLRNISEEVKTLQLCVAQQYRTCQESSDKSKSTKSGSVCSVFL